MEITKVGIVGCGTMGAGIALSCARSGYTTLVLELSQQLLNRGFEDIGARLDADISSGLMAAQEKEGVLNNLAGTLEICDLAGCDIVIEAAPEKIELKQELLKKLEGVISTKCVLATNTSSLPIINIASVLEHPERVVGLHFCHPAHIRELVELISSIRTSTDVTETAYEFATSLGKTVIRAKDQPGFILNYLQYPFRLNAIRMVERGRHPTHIVGRHVEHGNIGAFTENDFHFPSPKASEFVDIRIEFLERYISVQPQLENADPLACPGNARRSRA